MAGGVLRHREAIVGRVVLEDGARRQQPNVAEEGRVAQEVAEGHELAQASRRDGAVDGGILQQGANLGRKCQPAMGVDVVHRPETESIVDDRQPLPLAVPHGDGKAAVHAFEEVTALEPHATHEQRGHVVVLDANTLPHESGPRVGRVVHLAFVRTERRVVRRQA